MDVGIIVKTITWNAKIPTEYFGKNSSIKKGEINIAMIATAVVAKTTR